MTVRIGMVGAGGIARAHLKALSQVEGAQVVGIYDVFAESAEAAAREAGATACASLEQLLDGMNIQALIVCVPQFARGNIEEMACERGIHILMEKPLGISAEEVRRKEAIVRQSGIIHSSGYVLRYLDTVRQLKEILDGQELDMIVSHRFGGVHPPRWWWTMEQSGGQLVDQTTHQIDLIRYIAGEITEISARYARRSILQSYPEATIYDVGTMTFSLASGAIGSLSQSCHANHHKRSDIEFFTNDLYAALSKNGSLLYIKQGDSEQEIPAKVRSMVEQDRAFVEAVRTGRQDLVLCSYADALKTLEVTLAANESAASGHPVRLSAQ